MNFENMDILVSVIVPTYNTPKNYFKQCIESLANQSYQNLEILVIDDGSEKKFADYCDELTAQYPERKFKVFHRKNSGVSASRNFGIEQAKGEYLLFVDSDDIVGKYYAETLLSVILKYRTDIAKCGFQRFTESNQLSGKDNKPSGEMYYQEKEEIFKGFYSSYLWDKIFSKSVFQSIRFPEKLTMCEDVLFISTLLNKNPVCPAVAEPLYFYRINPWSLTETPNPKKCLQAVKVYEKVRELPFIKNNPDMLANRIVHCCRWRLRYMMALVQEKPNGWREKFSDMRKKYLADMLPIQDYADTKFMKTSIPIINLSEGIAIAYLSAVSAVKKSQNKKSSS
ncbi:MAG TPA: hypothetical protein DCO72_09275 [Ruminococcus sp.]|nr:hypothetical protein [Ruminococcus sp.]